MAEKADLRTRQKGFVSTALAVIITVPIMAAVMYLAYSYQMSGYYKYTACNPGSHIGKIGWLFGVRPAPSDCWH